MTSRGLWSRRTTLAGLAAGLAAPAPASGQPTGTRLPEAPAEGRPAGDSGALLETAFDRALRMTVPAFLDGKGPFDFVVDTGANRSVVSTEIAQFCRLPPAGTAPVHGIIGAQTAPLVKVRRMRVGAVTSAGLQLPTLAQSRVGAGGILGLDMLRGRRIVLGFRDQSFQIAASGGVQIGRGTNSRLSAPDQGVTVPARFRFGQLVIIDAEAAGHGITAFLDSGSQVSVANRAMRDLMLAARPDIASRFVHSELISATGQRAAAEFAPLPGLRLGGQRLESPLVAFADLHIFELWELQDRPTVLVGVDILRRFDQVAFDFGRKQITFWPARSPVARRRPG